MILASVAFACLTMASSGAMEWHDVDDVLKGNYEVVTCQCYPEDTGIGTTYHIHRQCDEHNHLTITRKSG